jgi:hypothetical protein
MSYYQGDFYRGAGSMRGDFYRGDPGFFSFLGGLAKKAVGFIPGVGPIASAALSTIPSGGSKLARAVKSSPLAMKAGRAIIKHPVLSAAGAAGAIGMMGAGVGAAVGRRGMVHAGRRHRRMNVCNPRALRRSIRRTQGFAKLAMRTIHLVHPKKKARFGGFKRRTKKRA